MHFGVPRLVGVVERADKAKPWLQFRLVTAVLIAGLAALRGRATR